MDCIVQLTGQLFANTQIPCGLWFLSKNRGGQGGFRKRKGEILFIDARKFGTLIPGSRKQKQLSDDEIGEIAAVYQEYRRKKKPEEIAGICRVATLEEVREHNYALTPGRFVGSAAAEDDDEPFEEKMARLTAKLGEQFKESAKLEKAIRANLKGLGYEI